MTCHSSRNYKFAVELMKQLPDHAGGQLWRNCKNLEIDPKFDRRATGKKIGKVAFASSLERTCAQSLMSPATQTVRLRSEAWFRKSRSDLQLYGHIQFVQRCIILLKRNKVKVGGRGFSNCAAQWRRKGSQRVHRTTDVHPGWKVFGQRDEWPPHWGP